MEDRLHRNEIAIDVDLVRKLVDNEDPQYSGLTLKRLEASGSSNVLYRLGDDLLVRLPRQPGGGRAIVKEHRWLPEIGRHLTVAVPEILTLGKPADGFKEQWSIVRWLPGELAQACTLDDPPAPEHAALASDLADVILALRAIDVSEAAVRDSALRSYRGGTLAAFDEQMHRNIRLCRSIDGLDLDLNAVLSVWTAAQKLPGANTIGLDRWYHSDLVAENLLLSGGRLTGVLDFGSLAVGDPTIDLHGAWEVLDPPAREIFRSRLQVDDAEWLRGRAWALGIALGAFSYYWDKMPKRRQDRLAMARSVLADTVDDPVV